MNYILLVYTQYETTKYVDIYPLNSKEECVRKGRYLMKKGASGYDIAISVFKEGNTPNLPSVVISKKL